MDLQVQGMPELAWWQRMYYEIHLSFNSYIIQDHIRRANMIVLDANVAPSALAFAAKLANHARVSVWFAPVSVAKVLV